jgi:hypothetical protein
MVDHVVSGEGVPPEDEMRLVGRRLEELRFLRVLRDAASRESEECGGQEGGEGRLDGGGPPQSRIQDRRSKIATPSPV